MNRVYALEVLMISEEFFHQIRIEKIRLTGVKGVSMGVVEFDCIKNPVEKANHADILGMYGPNGSGKTTFLEALIVVRAAMMGFSMNIEHVKKLIACESDHSRIEITFQSINPDQTIYHIEYSFSLGVEQVERPFLDDYEISMLLSSRRRFRLIMAKKSYFLIRSANLRKSIRKKKGHTNLWRKKSFYFTSFGIKTAVIFDEVVRISGNFFGEETRWTAIFDSRTNNEVFLPKAKHSLFFPCRTSSVMRELKSLKKRARVSSCSFVFSREVTKMMKDQIDLGANSQLPRLIVSMQEYAEKYIRVSSMHTKKTELYGFYVLELANGESLLLDRDSSLVDFDSDIKKTQAKLKLTNSILRLIIPGLSLQIKKNQNTKETQNHTPGKKLALYSVRNNVCLPFGEESDGIIRIVSNIGLFVSAFANPQITVAIDEIDAGVYEHLLGELLLFFQKNGRGQLIFTCHNLRPLEVLNKRFICFTTTNPNNRYIKLKSIRNENNLRDVYLREIVNGGQEEELYQHRGFDELISILNKEGDEI